MFKAIFDVGQSGSRIEQVPKCFYNFVTIYNNTRFDFTIFQGNSNNVRDIIGACPAYTTLTFPHDKLTDIVNIVWSGGGGVVTVGLERCKIFFTEENLGLLGQFRAPEAAPVVAPIITPVRDVLWPTFALVGTSATNAGLTLTLPAQAGVIHVVTGMEAVNSGAATAVDVSLVIRRGAIELWRSFLGSGAARGTRTGFVSNILQGEVNQAISVESIAGGAGCLITLNLSGYSRAV